MSLAETSNKRSRTESNEVGNLATSIVNAAEIMHSACSPKNIATISSGFEKGDFLVREEQGNRVYFDFFEEAFNYIASKGYVRMSREQETDWIALMNNIHDSIKGGMRYNTGVLLMVLERPVPEEKLKANLEKNTSAKPQAEPTRSKTPVKAPIKNT